MSILKDVKMPALPIALGFVLSATVALQTANLPASAQMLDGSESIATQTGGIEAMGGDDIEGMAPQFAAMLPPPSGDAFHMGHGGPGGEGGHHGMFSEANKMSDDQFEKLYAIKEEMKDQMGSKMVLCGSLHRKLKDALSASTIDTKLAQDLESKISALKADMSSIKIDSLIKMAQVLTPDQRHELRMKMIKGSLGGHHHHHWGHHEGGGHSEHGEHGGPGGPGGPGGHG